MAVTVENLPDKALQTRFFVALLPPAEIQTYAANIIQDLSQRYHTHTSHSPPHITLQPPFLLDPARLLALTASLQTLAREHTPLPIVLSNFGAFAPRVLYLNVVKTPELLTLQSALSQRLVVDGLIAAADEEDRPYVPHLTVASRKLTRQTFQQAWAELQSQTVQFQFVAERLTLLMYLHQRWQVQSEFKLG